MCLDMKHFLAALVFVFVLVHVPLGSFDGVKENSARTP